MKTARLLLRLVVGGLFMGHGAQKLFGWFGGHGIKATGQFFEQLGMRPGRRNAIAAGLAEAGGGAALVVGLATPLAGAALTATMVTAISRVHLKNGPWASDGGFEYNLVLIAAVLSLVDLGPGQLSLDAALSVEKSGPGWALAAGTAGVAGAVGAHLLAQASAPPQEGAAPAPQSEPQESAAPAPEDIAAPAPSAVA
jgi:putative oxidoreductase